MLIIIDTYTTTKIFNICALGTIYKNTPNSVIINYHIYFMSLSCAYERQNKQRSKDSRIRKTTFIHEKTSKLVKNGVAGV